MNNQTDIRYRESFMKQNNGRSLKFDDDDIIRRNYSDKLDENSIKTIFNDLKNSDIGNQQKNYVKLLETKFEELIIHEKTVNSDLYYKLTPTEIKVAGLIRIGNTSKEIANLLNISTRTVEVHRNNIRQKLGISNKKVNLRIYLMTN